ncbi:hypothetical protein D9M68_728900 [compost metagenome]
MQDAAADDFAAHQIAQLEFEADGEQQQKHAKMGEVIEDDAVVRADADVFTDGGQCEASAQVADQRRQPDIAGKQAQDEGKGDPAGFNHREGSARAGGADCNYCLQLVEASMASTADP